MKIQGKVAIVLGGARGQGKAHCIALLDRGAQVCIADILTDEGTQTTNELGSKYGKDNVCFQHCDVTKEEHIEDVFKKAESSFGPVEIFITTAGIMQEFQWQLCVDVNLGGTIRCVNAALEHMGKHKGGKGGVFVCTSSISGLKPEDGRPIYSAVKHAQVAYMRSWAMDKSFGFHGIRMNSICTTRVGTKFLDQCSPDRIMFADDLLHNEEEGRELSPDTVAEGFIRLVEDDSLNGQTMRITVLQGIELVQFPEQPAL